MDAIGTHGASAPVAAPRGRRTHAYESARRNSTRVRLLKRLIPVGAVVGVVGVIGFAFFNPFGRVEGVSIGPVSLSGTKVTMENPRLTGYRNDTRPYEVTAVAATQDVRKPNVIELQTMRGRLAMDDGGNTARLEAKTGVFDTTKEQLELKDDIRVHTDNGQQVLMRSASVDFKAGTLVTRDPVAVSFPGGSVDADTMRVTDSGKTITFEGRVKTILQPGAQPKPRSREDAAPQASVKAPPPLVESQPNSSSPPASAPARAAAGGQGASP